MYPAERRILSRGGLGKGERTGKRTIAETRVSEVTPRGVHGAVGFGSSNSRGFVSSLALRRVPLIEKANLTVAPRKSDRYSIARCPERKREIDRYRERKRERGEEGEKSEVMGCVWSEGKPLGFPPPARSPYRAPSVPLAGLPDSGDPGEDDLKLQVGAASHESSRPSTSSSSSALYPLAGLPALPFLPYER